MRKGNLKQSTSLFILIEIEVKLIGVCPGNSVKFPKTTLLSRDPFELSKGHTHIFMTYEGNLREKTS